MLEYLSIKNFALIENSEINFSNNLNIITGETGAGKSIIIQAIAILLGGRATVEHIRSGMEEAVLNATIDISGQKEIIDYLNNLGITVENNELLLRRILTCSGKSRSFINSAQVTSKELNVISSALFDFHGQNEGISLLKKSTHLNYLDSYLKLGKELETLRALYKELKKVKDSLKFIEESKKDKERQLELLQYEIEEIEASNINDAEDENLKKEIKIFENIEKITSSLDEAYGLFMGENGITSRMKNLKKILTVISEMDPSMNSTANDLSDIYYQTEEIFERISAKKSNINFEPGKLDKLIERNELIEKLKRKYGGSINGIKDYLEKAKSELNLITFSSQQSDKLKEEKKELENRFINLALSISAKRKQGCKVLEDKVKNELFGLAMNDVEFKINIEMFAESSNETSEDMINFNGEKYKITEKGIDNVEFLISPNKGEPLKSLIKIASGGELSRIILALKSVLVEDDNIKTMIFDEIDSGIGGKVGLSVGKSLKRLGKYKQIICITHLPQIAAGGTKNFLINKNVVGGRTISTIESVDNKDKVNEIARMLSGHITDVSMNHAKELINELALK
ncbi:MAG: DNA repair protein RecN [Spirochaetes bacterium]|nr:DNA repair protein RecN [Spirochaetota bacterium]